MLTIIKSSFIDYKLTILRNKTTPTSLFRQTMNEISYLIAAEVLQHLDFKKTFVQTPLKKSPGKILSKKVVIVPILRAGLGLVEGFNKCLPNAENGHIGIYRDDLTYMPVKYSCNLPKSKNKIFIILEPMLATGNSALEAISLINDSSVKISNILLVSLLAAPEGLKNIKSTYPRLKIFTTSVDLGLNKNKFIIPGLGDAGDRYMGT